jgi:hypothetical protein
MNEFSIAVSVVAVVTRLIVVLRGTRRARVIGVVVLATLMSYVLYFGVHLAIRRMPVVVNRTQEYLTGLREGATSVQERVNEMLGAVAAVFAASAILALARGRSSRERTKESHKHDRLN